MNDEIRYIDDNNKTNNIVKDDSLEEITIPDWNIEPPFEVERQTDDEL